MAKLRDEPIGEDDLGEYLASQDDFALELYVYSLAREKGLQTTHGGTYVDPVTSKARQYDIRASHQLGNRRVNLAIECKSLRPNFPLLVSRIPRIRPESFHEVMCSSKPDLRLTRPTYNPEPAYSATLDRQSSLYPPGEMVGKSTVQVGRTVAGDLTGGDSEVFDKWAQALASADDLIASAVHGYRRTHETWFFTVVLPVLVVSDNTLWVADYSEYGDLTGPPRSVDEVLLYVGREYSPPAGPPFRLSHLHIYTKAGVNQFLETLVHDSNYLDQALPLERLHSIMEGP